MPLESYDTTTGIKGNRIWDCGTVCAVFLFHAQYTQKSYFNYGRPTYNTSWAVINHVQSNDGWSLANIGL